MSYLQLPLQHAEIRREVVYAIIALLNIVASICVVTHTFKMSQGDRMSVARTLFCDSTCVLQLAGVLLVGLIYMLPAAIFRCLLFS